MDTFGYLEDQILNDLRAKHPTHHQRYKSKTLTRKSVKMYHFLSHEIRNGLVSDHPPISCDILQFDQDYNYYTITLLLLVL
jgi:hypothetical protein